MTIAISGATGQLGRAALAALARPDLVALARDPSKAPQGIEARAFDYAAPDASALKGVDTFVLISSNSFEDRAGDHLRAIEAAKTAGVRRIIYTSILKGTDSPLEIAEDHKITERAIRASGLPFTILRNGWYIENFTGSLQGAIAHGAMAGAAGDARFSSAARQDFAEAIAATVGEGHAGQVYELAGDNAHTMADIAAEVSRITGKTIPYHTLPEADYAAMLAAFGLPPAFAAMLADADVQARAGGLYDDSRTLSRLIGRPTTPMAKVVQAALAA